ncbi:MAG: hypothetical protein AAFV77_13025, partial [Planctomycetota bacterium]
MHRSVAQRAFFPIVLAVQVACVLTLAPALSGCASRGSTLSGDHLTDLGNPELRVPERVAAMRAAWEDPNADREKVR